MPTPEERIAALEAHREHMAKTIDEMSADVKAILSKLDQQKGGWKVMAAIGTVAGGAGALVSKKLGLG